MHLIKSIFPSGIKVEPNKHYNFQNYNQIDSHSPSCNSLVCHSLCSSSIDSRFGRQGNELWYSVHRLSPPSALRVIPLPNSITLLPALRLSPIFRTNPADSLLHSSLRFATPLFDAHLYSQKPKIHRFLYAFSKEFFISFKKRFDFSLWKTGLRFSRKSC